MKTKEININQLEGKTIGEIIQMSKQQPNLPIGFKMKVHQRKTQSAQELLDSIK